MISHVCCCILKKSVLSPNDVFIASQNYQELFQHFETVLQIFREHKLCINVHKPQFAQEDITYLGYHIKAPDDGIEDIASFSHPKICEQLQRFLGFVEY